MISLRVSATKLTNNNRIENPKGFSEAGENKQLLIAIVPVAQDIKKGYQEKRFTDFRLSDRIPKENFYHRLKYCLHLEFRYSLTKG